MGNHSCTAQPELMCVRVKSTPLGSIWINLNMIVTVADGSKKCPALNFELFEMMFRTEILFTVQTTQCSVDMDMSLSCMCPSRAKGERSVAYVDYRVVYHQ